MKQFSFIKACKNNDLESAKELISEVDVNFVTDQGPPIVFSTLNGYFDIVELLIKHEAKIDSQDCQGYTALMNASYHGFHDIAKLLTDKNADINIANKNGYTALMCAAASPIDSVVEHLINLGVTLDGKIYDGKTALFFATTGYKKHSIELLINAGANVDIKDNMGQTAYDIATELNDIQMMVLLRPAIINEQDKNGNTLLMNACQLKRGDDALFLLNKGADFLIENNQGDSVCSILEAMEDMPDALRSLKEKLVLERDINDNQEDILCL